MKCGNANKKAILNGDGFCSAGYKYRKGQCLNFGTGGKW